MSVIYRFPYDSPVRYLPLVYLLPYDLIFRFPTLRKLPRSMGALSSSVGLSDWRWAFASPHCGSRGFIAVKEKQ